MPNYKIFQDVADEARVKVYGVNNLAVSQDAFGNVALQLWAWRLPPRQTASPLRHR